MDTVTILRDLWRHRALVVGAYLVALLAGIAVLYNISFPPKLESRKYEVGVAAARILVDTPSSQVVEVAPKGSDSLGVRANLLASLMVDGVVKSAIAHRAGLSPDKLVGITSADTEPAPAGPPPGHRAFVLTTSVVMNAGGDQLPLIEIDAQGPDAVSAARLARAAVSGLRDYLDSKAALQRVPDADRLQVSGLGAPQAQLESRGPGDILAVVAVVFVFGLGCACIFAGTTLARNWRARTAEESLAQGGLLSDDEPTTAHMPYDQTAAPQESEVAGDSWLVPVRPTLVAPTSARRVPAREDDEPRVKSG